MVQESNEGENLSGMGCYYICNGKIEHLISEVLIIVIVYRFVKW